MTTAAHSTQVFRWQVKYNVLNEPEPSSPIDIKNVLLKHVEITGVVIQFVVC